MNITSKRLDKIKKTKNQSKRRIHYKNKKKNGKEKNRRKNRKYNKSTGKYRKTHKRKKRAYDLKNKSLKFKENQPGKKPAPLKIMTTDKPVETVQTGGGLWLWDNFKKLFKRANTKKKEEIDGLKDEIFNIISVNKENDNVKDFYQWYIDELIKIAFETDGENPIYVSKRFYYDENLKEKAFGNAIKELQVNLNKADENKADRLYDEKNKTHLIDIFKHTLTDAKKHLKVLFDGTPKKTGQVVPIENAILENKNGKKIKYTNPDETINIYDFTHLTLKMDEILKAAAEKKAEEEREAVAKKKEEEEKEKKEREAAAAAEKEAAAKKKAEEEKEKKEEEEKEKKEREAAAAAEKEAAAKKKAKKKAAAAEKEAAAAKKKTEEDKKPKTEEEINNIKNNIKTPEIDDFLEEVKKENGPYSDFLKANEGKPFKMLIENSKVMTGGADDEEEEEEETEEEGSEEEGKKGTEKGAEEGEQQTNDDDNLVKIYDYLMNKDNQDKIRKYLTEKENTTELEKFDAMIEGIKYAKFAEARYALPEHISNIMLLKPGVAGADTAVMSTDTSDLKTTDALVDLGNFEKHVTAAQEVVDDDQPLQSGGYREIYDMMRKYYNDKTADQWKEENWFKLGKKLAGLINKSDKENFLEDLNKGRYGEPLLVADAMQKVLENIDGENKMTVGIAYANKDDLEIKIDEAMNGMKGFKLKAIIRGTDEFNCDDGPKQRNESRSVGHFDSFVKLEDDDSYVYFDAGAFGTKLNKENNIPEIVDIKDYLPNDPSCNYLIFLFNMDKEYPTTENLEGLKVTTKDNGNDRCWINATLYAVLFGIMNKEKKNSEEEVGGE